MVKFARIRSCWRDVKCSLAGETSLQFSLPKPPMHPEKWKTNSSLFCVSIYLHAVFYTFFCYLIKSNKPRTIVFIDTKRIRTNWTIAKQWSDNNNKKCSLLMSMRRAYDVHDKSLESIEWKWECEYISHIMNCVLQCVFTAIGSEIGVIRSFPSISFFLPTSSHLRFFSSDLSAACTWHTAKYVSWWERTQSLSIKVNRSPRWSGKLCQKCQQHLMCNGKS